jgi:hypothetical protein
MRNSSFFVISAFPGAIGMAAQKLAWLLSYRRQKLLSQKPRVALVILWAVVASGWALSSCRRRRRRRPCLLCWTFPSTIVLAELIHVFQRILGDRASSFHSWSLIALIWHRELVHTPRWLQMSSDSIFLHPMEQNHAVTF